MKMIGLQMQSTVELECVRDLYARPYSAVPFSIGADQIQSAMDAFLNFLSLPEDVKRHIDMKIAPRHRRGDLGYKSRVPEEDIYNDSKEFFHYHPVILNQYEDYIKTQPVLENFLAHAAPLWNVVYAVIRDVLSCFEKDFPGTLKKVFDTDSPHIVLRFLKYDFAVSGAYLAKPHFDAGSFTLAIAESCPGLRIGTNPEDLALVQHEDQKALFMISSNYRKIIDTDLLKPGWHDVVQLDSTHIGKPFSRWALVAFIDGVDVEALSRDETHKWFKAEGVEKVR